MSFVKQHNQNRLVKRDGDTLENDKKTTLFIYDRLKKLSPVIVSAYIAATAHFYDMNEQCYD